MKLIIVLKLFEKLLKCCHSFVSGLVKHYGPDHLDYSDCIVAQSKLKPVIENVPSTLRVSVSSKIIAKSVDNFIALQQ